MLKNKCTFLLSIIASLLIVSCKEEPLPKPDGQLRLEYPVANYDKFENQCPFTFSMNENAEIKEDKACGFEIKYPKMKATLFITYKQVNGNIDKLLRDAQKLTYEHVIKADGILEQPYFNKKTKVYGMFYEVNGNAATNSQFYATDNEKHFVTGSVYFYAKPNFDSIMPAADYIKNDMRTLMETLKWK